MPAPHECGRAPPAGLLDRRLRPPVDDDHAEAPPSLSDMQDEALSKIIWHALDEVTLLQVSLVCRRWSIVVCQEESWARKEVYIASLPMPESAIVAWFARWRQALVIMTYAQKDSVPKPIAQVHAIVHPWGVYSNGSRCTSSWHKIWLSATPWRVCMTAQRGPRSARVIQYPMGDGNTARFQRPITLGWTSAACPEEFALICSRIARGRSRAADVIVATTLYPEGYWSRLLVALRATGIDPPASRPISFDEHSEALGTFILDRARRTIQIDTGLCGGEVNCSGGPIGEGTPLAFFVAVSVEQGPLAVPPQPRVPQLDLETTVFLGTPNWGGSFFRRHTCE